MFGKKEKTKAKRLVTSWFSTKSADLRRNEIDNNRDAWRHRFPINETGGMKKNQEWPVEECDGKTAAPLTKKGQWNPVKTRSTSSRPTESEFKKEKEKKKNTQVMARTQSLNRNRFDYVGPLEDATRFQGTISRKKKPRKLGNCASARIR